MNPGLCRQQQRRRHGKDDRRQSIVVAGVATGQQGNEGEILRYVFWHSIALAFLVGVLVLL